MSNIQTSAFRTMYARLKPWVELSRVHKFAGTMVLFWPYAWSLTTAARVFHLHLTTYSFALFLGFIGASLLHSWCLRCIHFLQPLTNEIGGGCVWNDILDREFDRQVERTKHRPIADGRISVPGALVFLAMHISLLLMMIWDFNPAAFQFGVLAIVGFPGVYPFMKRITYWPQAWLGIAMNVGVPMAWLALKQTVPFSIMVLSVGAWAWTMWYDTIYACQDKRDDVKAGVKSTALLFGAYIKPILAVFAGMLIGSLTFSGFMNGLGVFYFAISVGCAGLFMARELYTVNLDSPKDCWNAFHRNGFHFGALVWAGAFADYLTSL